MTTKHSESAPLQPSFGRRLLFSGLILLLLYGFLEAVSFIAYSTLTGDFFSFATLQVERNQAIAAPSQPIRAADTANDRFADQVVHPYTGYVFDPDVRQGANEYGFADPRPPFGRANETTDNISVAVLGGSVAAGLVARAKSTLRQDLENLESFAGKEVRIFSLAIGGMKQPQQLMVVNYFMSLGAHFDVVINLDGFNDIVLPLVANESVGTFPFYPRGWKWRVSGFTDQNQLRDAGRVAYVEWLRQSIARFFSRVPTRYSVTANFLWDRLDLWLERSITDSRLALTEDLLAQGTANNGDKRQYVETGPARTYASDEERYRDLAAFWKRSSMILHNLALGSGFRYFHFLQPNQYVAGSKIFSDEERAIAIAENRPYGRTATVGYPYLIEAGRELAGAGVAFTDLTMLFDGVSEALYVDACCHFNERGYQLIAAEIARVIEASMQSGID